MLLTGVKARVHGHGRFVVVTVRQRVVVVVHVFQCLRCAIAHGVRVVGRMRTVKEV